MSTAAGSARATGALRTLRRMLSRLAPARGLVLAVYALTLLGVAISLSLPFLAGTALDRVVTLARSHATGGLPWRIFAAYLALVILENGLRSVGSILRTRVEAATLARYRMDLVSAVQKLGFRFHDRSSAGELIAKTTRDVERLGPLYADFVFSTPELTLLLAGASVMVLRYDALLGGILALFSFLYVYLTFRYASRLRLLWEEAGDQYDTVTSVVQESIAGVRVVKAFGAAARELDRFGGRLKVYRDLCVRAEHFWTNRAPVASLVFWSSLPLSLAWGGARVIRGELTVGCLAAVVFYLVEMHQRLRIVSRVVQGIENALASGARVFELLDENERVPESAAPAEPRTARGEVRLENVSFEYGTALPALREVSFSVAPGETVALVGPTGSGKSTVMALIPRFYDATAGKILVDGVDVREYGLGALRGRIGLVFQETFLFSATIAENIAFGRPGATREEVEEAARLAQAHDFISELEAGFDTLVGERGINLSGGQKQRLAIARAILADPRVLILDDATSSVDARTEEALQAALQAVARGRTTILIAQRLTSVLHADRVVVLEGGRKVAEGRHAELMLTCPLYEDLFRGQWLEEETRRLPIARP
ncbi:MAG: ABC transporter ATP-binding protein [Planctomycetes bacterium]|nr:ABC transporter ATP-binding protein [Planctomycetota bacterium]